MPRKRPLLPANIHRQQARVKSRFVTDRADAFLRDHGLDPRGVPIGRVRIPRETQAVGSGQVADTRFSALTRSGIRE